jgi:ABC-type oligopeptide transport system ATPase subunit
LKVPLINPLQKFRCLFCDHEFFLNESAIVSGRTGNVLRPSMPDTDLLSRFWVRPLDGPTYVQEDARRQCPKCKRLLPYRFEVSKQMYLAIVGDSGSGKSHYIATLIEQISNGLMAPRGNVIIDFSWLDKESEQRFQEYHDIIFRDKTEFPPTPAQAEPGGNNPIIIEPLMFQLTIRDTRYPTRFVPSVNVIIYDIGGEDIVDPTKLSRFGRNIPRAQSIIYLADPGTMPNVVSQLPPHLQPAPTAQPRTAYSTLESVMRTFERWRHLTPGERVNTPIAIMVSKSDLLTYAIPQQEQASCAFLQDTVYDGRANLRDVHVIDMQLRTLLTKLGEDRLLRNSERFANARFFACSATGESANTYGQFQQIKPIRCLDPFMWLLERFGTLGPA